MGDRRAVEVRDEREPDLRAPRTRVEREGPRRRGLEGGYAVGPEGERDGEPGGAQVRAGRDHGALREPVNRLERADRALGRHELRVVLLTGDDIHDREVDEQEEDEEGQHRGDGRRHSPGVPLQAAHPGCVLKAKALHHARPEEAWRVA